MLCRNSDCPLLCWRNEGRKWKEMCVLHNCAALEDKHSIYPLRIFCKYTQSIKRPFNYWCFNVIHKCAAQIDKVNLSTKNILQIHSIYQTSVPLLTFQWKYKLVFLTVIRYMMHLSPLTSLFFFVWYFYNDLETQNSVAMLFCFIEFKRIWRNWSNWVLSIDRTNSKTAAIMNHWKIN